MRLPCNEGPGGSSPGAFAFLRSGVDRCRRHELPRGRGDTGARPAVRLGAADRSLAASPAPDHSTCPQAPPIRQVPPIRLGVRSAERVSCPDCSCLANARIRREAWLCPRDSDRPPEPAALYPAQNRRPAQDRQRVAASAECGSDSAGRRGQRWRRDIRRWRRDGPVPAGRGVGSRFCRTRSPMGRTAANSKFIRKSTAVGNRLPCIAGKTCDVKTARFA